MSVIVSSLICLSIGLTLGVVLGSLLASNKSRDLHVAYTNLSSAVRNFLRASSREKLKTRGLPAELESLKHATDDADDLAGYPTWNVDEHEESFSHRNAG